MDNIRVAVLSAYDQVCTFLDNNAPGAMHYYQDELHTYLAGSAYTLSFTTSSNHEDTEYLVVGNKLSFLYKGKGYYCNIVNVETDGETVKSIAYGLSFELINEETGPYKSPKAMSFEEYIKAFNFEQCTMIIGRNEVSDKRLSHEWEGTETILARLFSLAKAFGAELEFVTGLNKDYSLKMITLNIYKEHNNEVQGIGTDSRGEVIRYGNGISGITKTSDITELYTAIRPTGKDGLTLAGIDKVEYDKSGKIEFSSQSGWIEIYAHQARDRFPSTLMAGVNSRYIAKVWTYETENVNTLYGQALAELKKNCVPKVSYSLDGFVDADIGDTFTIEDKEYNPILYLEARITEQQICFTDKTMCKTTFDNFVEKQSQIDTSLIKKMNAMIEANKVYACSIITDNGIIFKDEKGTTTLTASVMDGGADKTAKVKIQWYKDNAAVGNGKSLWVNASDVAGKSVYRFEALDGTTVRGTCEVTIVHLRDGEDAILIHVDSVNGYIFKNTGVSTILVLTIIAGETVIHNSQELRDSYGSNAKIIWEYKNVGEMEFTQISNSDHRLSDNGFMFAVTPEDVKNKISLKYNLDY